MAPCLGTGVRRRRLRRESTAVRPTASLPDNDVPSFYKHHIFFCINKRDGGRECCQDKGAEGMQSYAKKRVKELGLAGAGQVRVNKSGCLDRCELGPVAVVYPDNVWYTYIDESDIDEIVESHLRDGKPVERLRLPDA